VKPVLQALVLADRVYEDKVTGKKIIAGTFSSLHFKRQPPPAKQPGPEGEMMRMEVPASGVNAGSPYAYVSVTDIHKEAKLVLRYVNLESHQLIFQTEVTVTCDDCLRTVELAVPLLPLPSVTGVYAFEVLCEDELLGAHRVLVRELTDS
jgi:hypothetical protein